jgi:NADPH:quinone reductase-like Zn-dependent oxidoreductase
MPTLGVVEKEAWAACSDKSLPLECGDLRKTHRKEQAMRAVQIERFGGPEELEVAEISSPVPQGDEILLEVEAAGVNRADLLTRAGLYQRAGHTPLVPGFEGSGVVREVGDAVERFAPGDRVFAFGGRPASTPSGSRYRRGVSSSCQRT